MASAEFGSDSGWWLHSLHQSAALCINPPCLGVRCSVSDLSAAETQQHRTLFQDPSPPSYSSKFTDVVVRRSARGLFFLSTELQLINVLKGSLAARARLQAHPESDPSWGPFIIVSCSNNTKKAQELWLQDVTYYPEAAPSIKSPRNESRGVFSPHSGWCCRPMNPVWFWLL